MPPRQTCGACCSFSREWPRFSLEDDTALERIPLAFVDDNQGRMRCDGDRCSALVGDVGVSTACAVYGARPDVVLLDIGLPELDGWSTLDRIRQLTDIPVMMVTGQSSEPASASSCSITSGSRTG